MLHHSWRLTDLQDVRDGALVQQAHPLAERRVLVVQRVAGGAARRAIHSNVALVPRKGPEDEALLHRLGYPREPLLDPLKRNSFGN